MVESKTKNRKKRFVTLFPECENVHLMKEQGMVPYFMKQKFDMEGIVACYADENYQTYGEKEFTYLKQLNDGLKIEKIQRLTGNIVMDAIFYLAKQARKIDILYIFHLGERSLYWYTIYKMFNPRGKVYLELDADKEILGFEFNKFSIRHHLEKRMLRKCALVSNSIKSVAEELSKKWETPVRYIPRGFYTDGIQREVSYHKKKNIFCTVGRIGTWQKATEILLEGYKIFAKQNSDWQLRIIGPIEREFEMCIEQFFSENPQLVDRIVFTGGIYDKKKLDEEYASAKVFCITSRLEAFALVYAEAMKNGCYIISSDVDCVNDVLEHEKYGSVFKIDDSVQLAEKMRIIAEKDDTWFQRKCELAQMYAYREFFWPNICKSIYNYLYMNKTKEKRVKK